MLNMMELESSLTGKPIEAIDHKTDRAFLHATSASDLTHSQSLNHLFCNHRGATDPAGIQYETSLDNLTRTYDPRKSFTVGSKDRMRVVSHGLPEEMSSMQSHRRISTPHFIERETSFDGVKSNFLGSTPPAGLPYKLNETAIDWLVRAQVFIVEYSSLISQDHLYSSQLFCLLSGSLLRAVKKD